MKRYIKSSHTEYSGDALAEQIASLLDKEGLAYEDCYCSEEDDDETCIVVYTPINYRVDKYIHQLIIDKFHPNDEEMYERSDGEAATHRFVFYN